MIVYNNQAPNAVNNVGQFGATEGSIGAYKQAAEYAADAKYWALLSQTKYSSIEDILAEVERLYAQGLLLEEDINQLKSDFETQQQVLLGLIQSTNTAIDNTNAATELSREATQDVLAQLDIISNMTVQTTLLPPGSMATGSYDNSTGVFSFGIPEGQPGRDGTDGTISDIGDVAVGVPVPDDYGFYVDKENGGLYRANMSDIANLIPSIRSISINGGEEQTGAVSFNSVSSFNSRTGGVVSEVGDYSVEQITGAAKSGANSDITSLSGLTTALSIQQGGTGAKNADDARTNLGLGSVAIHSVVPIDKGGTGATSASGARTNLGLGLVATESIVPVTKGGTGSTSAENARLALVAAKSGVNSDITSMTNVVTFTQPVSVADAVDATNAVNLGQISSDQGASLIGTLEGIPVQNIISNINTDIIQLKLNWAIENGYSDAGFTFTTGGTLTIDDHDKVVYDPVSKAWYSYSGALPVTVPTGLNPAGNGDWKPQTDPTLREELASSAVGKGVDMVYGAAKQTDLDTLSEKSKGYVNVLEYIPKNLHQYLTDLAQSMTNAGDLISYLNAASAYCETNHKDLVFPFGYYFISNTFMLPAGVKVIGQGYPYILSTASFNASNIIVSCDKTGQPTYDMECFNINGPGASNLDMVGLRVGGCRNSTFRRIVITSCFSAGVEVYPTVATSGDVENLHLDHIWTVQSGGVRFKANDAISRGNITDAEVTNCQLTTGSATLSGPPAITITGAPGRLIFGIEFSRVFTQVTDVDHIVINPNSGTISGNTFRDFSGESWTIAAGGISASFNKNTLYVLPGEFVANSFRDFYRQGLLGNGITLSSGASGNTFDGLKFADFNVSGFNNKWLVIASGANSNSFSNCYFDGCFNRANPGYGGVTANYVFRDFDGKISDLSGSTKFDTPEIRDVAPVLIKRSNIFAISGSQLVNYPVTGCDFATTSDGISVSVPAGNTAYFLTIPFTPTAGFAGKFIGLTIKYVCGEMNGMLLAADICGAGSSMTDLTQGKNNVFSAYGAYNSANKTVTISFLGDRSAQAVMVIQDIIITEGANIPYVPNFRKLYIES